MEDRKYNFLLNAILYWMLFGTSPLGWFLFVLFLLCGDELRD